MKTTIFFFTIALFLSACAKDNSTSDSDIPEWLKLKIEQDEATIKAHPELMQNHGAWYSYEFNGAIYYEYDNPLSSESRNPYSFAGVRVIITEAPFTDYWNQKCCEKLVWEAPHYNRI